MYDGWNKSGLTQRSGGIRLKIYQALAELSYFYRQLYTKEIKKDIMEKLKKEILMLLCKLEKNPPWWFNLMQHLFVHLSYEAKVDGPIQYR
jgi:hypothetical protein